jgi:hypothetical protein
MSFGSISDIALVIATIALVLATVALVYTTKRYAESTERLAKSTSEYVQATKNLVQVTNESKEISERKLDMEYLNFVAGIWHRLHPVTDEEKKEAEKYKDFMFMRMGKISDKDNPLLKAMEEQMESYSLPKEMEFRRKLNNAYENLTYKVLDRIDEILKSRGDEYEANH